MKNNRPIAYASRSLTDNEHRYAQIEKECLGIAWGCQKFHQYLYARPVHVESDHKPLESLFKKKLSSAPHIIQRMMLKLQMYDLTVSYKPGREMYIADTLSRAPIKNQGQTDDVSEFDDIVIHSIEQVSDSKLKTFEYETSIDPVMIKLKSVIRNGWPNSKSQLDNEIRCYWDYRDELSLHDGLITKGAKLVVPLVLVKEMINKIHSSHLGIEKCKQSP